MCWSNYIVIPIILKKPLRVYKVGTLTVLGDFTSAYRNCIYNKYNIMPTVKINLEFIKYSTFSSLDKSWIPNAFCINEGYHSYLTEGMAKSNMYSGKIGIFEIPAGATVYINYACKEVVSTDIKYLGKLEL